jgi:hypothetical protein
MHCQSVAARVRAGNLCGLDRSQALEALMRAIRIDFNPTRADDGVDLRAF